MHGIHMNILFLEWLRRRKITDPVIERFGIHGETEIVIPIRDTEGLFTFNKYRRSPLKDSGPKYWYDKGAQVTLFGAFEAKGAADIVVTEGEMDSLVCWSHNITAVSSTGGALSFQKEWLPLFNGARMIVVLDNDPTGGEGMARIWEMKPDAFFVFLPDRPGVKDISDYVTNGGDLHELLKTARAYETEEDVRNDMAERSALWKSAFFHEAVLKHIEDRRHKDALPKGKKADGTDIERAKAFPIGEMIEFRQGKAKCIWHNEKDGSMHYYSETNKVWCYGCGKGGDAIDVYMAMTGVAFKEAVRQLAK